MRRQVASRECLHTLHGGGSVWAMKLECGHEMVFRHNGSTKRKFPQAMNCGASNALLRDNHCDISPRRKS